VSCRRAWFAYLTKNSYGKNKITYVLHLRHLGYTFFSIAQAFVIHWPHGKSDSKVSWLRAREDKDKEGQQAKMDGLFEEFKVWLKKKVLSTGETPLCGGGGGEKLFKKMQQRGKG